MSRRLRKEQEKVLQIKEEEREDFDKLKLMKNRMYAPIVWKRMATGFRIEDIKEKHFEEVLDILKEYYLDEDVLCKNSEMSKDEVSTQSFLERCLFHLKDLSSIMAVDETSETEEIAGVVLLRAIHKDDFGRVFSRTMIVRGEAHQKCLMIKTALNRKVDLYEMFDCEIYLRIYIVCIKPKYRQKGIGFNMMSCTFYIARSMHIPVIMGIFDNHILQKYAKRLGMQPVTEINYVDWLNKDKNLVFDDPGAGNYTCSLYAGKVPQIPLPEQQKPSAIVIMEEKETKSNQQEKDQSVKKKK